MSNNGITLGQVVEQLNNKADVDFNNTQNISSSFIINMLAKMFPDFSVEPYTTQTSGYTATKYCWGFCMNTGATAGGISVNGHYVGQLSAKDTDDSTTCIPLSPGDVVTWTGAHTLRIFECKMYKG